MADPEPGKTNFHSILSSMNRKFDIIHMKWSEDKFFEAKFRTQIPRNNDDYNALCDEWVEVFSTVTNTIWVKKISNTGPKIKFRKQYQCWTQNTKQVQKELLFDARRCRATLDMKVVADNPSTRKKNKHIKKGLNVVVKINFIHLHKVNIHDSFAFFVHVCDPQEEVPKPIIQTSDTSQKIAEIVQKSELASQKLAQKHINAIPKVSVAPTEEAAPKIIENTTYVMNNVSPLRLELNPTVTVGEKCTESIQNSIQMVNLDQIQFNPILPIVNAGDIKLQVQPQFTQVVVAAPQLEVAESLLMCQPTFMFDTSQVIPITTHQIPHQFIPIHSHTLNNQQGQYL